MYHRPGLGQFDLGQDIMDRPEVSGVYNEFGYGYGGEHGLGISLKGIVRGIGRGVTAPFRKVVKPVAKRAFKIGKGAARVGFRAAKVAAPFLLPAAGGIAVAKFGLPVVKKLFRRKPAAALPAKRPELLTRELIARPAVVDINGVRKEVPTMPEVTRTLFEQPILRAEEPAARPSIAQIGREALTRALAPAAAAAGAPAEAAAAEETVTRPTMAGLMGGPMPLLLLGGAALMLLAGKGGRGRRRRR